MAAPPHFTNIDRVNYQHEGLDDMQEGRQMISSKLARRDAVMLTEEQIEKLVAL